jgi:hypothetical protein
VGVLETGACGVGFPQRNGAAQRAAPN